MLMINDNDNDDNVDLILLCPSSGGELDPVRSGKLRQTPRPTKDRHREKKESRGTWFMGGINRKDTEKIDRALQLKHGLGRTMTRRERKPKHCDVH